MTASQFDRWKQVFTVVVVSIIYIEGIRNIQTRLLPWQFTQRNVQREVGFESLTNEPSPSLRMKIEPWKKQHDHRTAGTLGNVRPFVGKRAAQTNNVHFTNRSTNYC